MLSFLFRRNPVVTYYRKPKRRITFSITPFTMLKTLHVLITLTPAICLYLCLTHYGTPHILWHENGFEQCCYIGIHQQIIRYRNPCPLVIITDPRPISLHTLKEAYHGF